MKHTQKLYANPLFGTDKAFSGFDSQLYACGAQAITDCFNKVNRITSFFEFCSVLNKYKKSVFPAQDAPRGVKLNYHINCEELKGMWLNVSVEECLNYYEVIGVNGKNIPLEVCRIVYGIKEVEASAFEASELLLPTHQDMNNRIKRTHGEKTSDEAAEQIGILMDYMEMAELFVRRDSLLMREEMRQTYKALCCGTIPADALTKENQLRFADVFKLCRDEREPSETDGECVLGEVKSLIRRTMSGLIFNVGKEYWARGIVLICTNIRGLMLEPGKNGVEGKLEDYARWVVTCFPLVGEVYTHEQLVRVLGKNEPYSKNFVRKVLGDDPKEFMR
ncbi:hypothetical protein [uncultured Bacteroides sp.]|uniref:hypothetical protein n=1 Tax=uncultured Bacteroides sp. TaxID=162156 RepID=UPI002AA84E59|nr:hypothetical protein [uncultured Bacteroides sp.]